MIGTKPYMENDFFIKNNELGFGGNESIRYLLPDNGFNYTDRKSVV